MPSGFFALLDDIAVLAKAAATSLDDVVLGAGKAAGKTAAVLVDDAAVSPSYVVGLSPKRELPVVWKIAMGSFKNKFLFVIPAAMILSWLAPGVLPYLLIVGGAYLCFEGAEKVLGWIGLVKPHHKAGTVAASGTELEKSMISGAVRTDLILSTEIMLISLASVDEDNWIKKLLMLLLIGFLMTVAVYGAVALLVKLDDIGLHLAQRKNRLAQSFGTGVIKVMPGVFKTLTVVGTLAMLWVGGHLVWKSVGDVGVALFADSLHGLEEFFHHYHPLLAWLGDTAASTLFGFITGAVLYYAIHPILKFVAKKKGTKSEASLAKES
jgi:predicted DNA repair protein MutK